MQSRFPYIRIIIFILFTALSHASVAQTSGINPEKAGIKKFFPPLSYIPAKTFVSLSHSGSDSVSDYYSRISSVKGYFISQTEVTNMEYREFVQYVKDSIAHRILKQVTDGNNIDWRQPINWEDDKLIGLTLPKSERLYGRPEIDSRRVTYEFEMYGVKQWIDVCPDTLVWLRDFQYSYNEPLVKKYFSNAEYDNYPVVGVNQKQAIAFCIWKTAQVKNKLGNASKFEIVIRLPGNNEWEGAAYGDNESPPLVLANEKYRWNSGPILDQQGYVIKTHKDDGYFYTSPVKTYNAGAYGLYDMRGNVAEWTSTSRDEVVASEVKEDKARTFYITKGGSWNSAPFYTQPGVCQFFKSTDSHSFIGFRYMVLITPK